MCELTVKELLHHPQEHLGKQVHLQGWVRTVRDVKACAFVELNDGSVVKNIQLVCPGGQPVYDMGRALTVGTAVEAQGTVTESQGNQPIEIQVESLRVEGECPSDYPLQKKRHSVEYLRTIAHLRPRTKRPLPSMNFSISGALSMPIPPSSPPVMQKGPGICSG